MQARAVHLRFHCDTVGSEFDGWKRDSDEWGKGSLIELRQFTLRSPAPFVCFSLGLVFQQVGVRFRGFVGVRMWYFSHTIIRN